MDGVDWNEWVAVKKAAFAPTSPQMQLLFRVTWNELEARLVISCQEQTAGADQHTYSRTSVFSIEDVAYIHTQLALVVPSLAPHLPPLPRPTKNLWGYVATVHVPPTLCASLETYLQTAQDLCGQTLLSSVLFDSATDEAYLEDMGDMRKQGYEVMYAGAQEELQSVLAMRPAAENMLHMSTVYALEDEVVANVSIALAELYNFRLQPFLDLRELACGKLRCTRTVLDGDDGGSKAAALSQYREWQEQHLKAIDHIRELYVEYYYTTTELVTGQRDRMLQDQKRFGRSTFEVGGLSRLHRLQQFVHEERLRWLRSQRLLQEHERDKAERRLMMASGSEATATVERIEAEIYDYQIGVLDLRLAILQEEELLLRHHLSAFAHSYSSDSGIFYDAPESTEEVNNLEDPSFRTDPQVAALKEKLVLLFRKRAAIRSRKTACISAKAQKSQQKKSKEQREQKQQAMQRKREERLRQDSLRKAKAEEERKSTLERLRTYRMRYPTPRVLKPHNQDFGAPPVNSNNVKEKIEEENGTTDSVCKPNRSEVVSVQETPVVVPQVTPAPFIPPPPPPPPPPPSIASRSKLCNSADFSPSQCIRISPPKQLNSATGAPTLQDLLAARSKLRRTDVPSDAKTRELLRLRPSGGGGASEGGLEAVLLGALERIRHVTKDDSDETQDSDFD